MNPNSLPYRKRTAENAQPKQEAKKTECCNGACKVFNIVMPLLAIVAAAAAYCIYSE